MKRMREEGLALAYSKADGQPYSLPLTEYGPLKAAWMAGKAFYEGHGFYGQPMTLRLGDIVALEEASPEVLALGRADRAAEKREDAIDS
jgi:hypothetical protein